MIMGLIRDTPATSLSEVAPAGEPLGEVRQAAPDPRDVAEAARLAAREAVRQRRASEADARTAARTAEARRMNANTPYSGPVRRPR